MVLLFRLLKPTASGSEGIQSQPSHTPWTSPPCHNLTFNLVWKKPLVLSSQHTVWFRWTVSILIDAHISEKKQRPLFTVLIIHIEWNNYNQIFFKCICLSLSEMSALQNLDPQCWETPSRFKSSWTHQIDSRFSIIISYKINVFSIT